MHRVLHERSLAGTPAAYEMYASEKSLIFIDTHTYTHTYAYTFAYVWRISSRHAGVLTRQRQRQRKAAQRCALASARLWLRHATPSMYVYCFMLWLKKFHRQQRALPQQCHQLTFHELYATARATSRQCWPEWNVLRRWRRRRRWWHKINREFKGAL